MRDESAGQSSGIIPRDNSTGQFCGLCSAQTEICWLAYRFGNAENGTVHTVFIHGIRIMCLVPGLRNWNDVRGICPWSAKDEVGLCPRFSFCGIGDPACKIDKTMRSVFVNYDIHLLEY